MGDIIYDEPPNWVPDPSGNKAKQRAFLMALLSGYQFTRMFQTLAPIAAKDEMEAMKKYAV